ncbi:MAG: PocR ligand-binding domain-containing protein, partial [Actinomycetes bacterium]
WQEWTNRAIFGDGDVVLRYQGLGRDITERRQAEQALRQSQQQYETFINATTDMAFLKDAELRYIIVNEANAAFFGRSVEDVIGRTDADLMPADGVANCRESDQAALRRDGVVISHEEIGSSVYETRKFPVELAGGHLGVGGYIRDVTDQILAEAALQQRIVALTQPLEDAGDIAFEDLFNVDDIQRLQDDFAGATGVASVITRVDGTVIGVPSNFCRLCKDIIRETDKGLTNCLKSDAALGRLQTGGAIVQPCLSGGLWDAGAGIAVGGRHIANWLIGQVRDETQTEAKMAEYAREIGVDEGEFLEAFREVPAMPRARFEQIAKALHSLASQLSTTAYQNVQQARFIADRQQAEAEIERLNADLERRVDERTAQLEATNKELESFAYAISHDLRAPLRALDGFSEIVIEDYGDRLDDVGRAHLESIRGAAHHMSGLMDGLLQLSRLNREELQRQPVYLSDMAAAIVADLRSGDAARTVDVSIGAGLEAEAHPKLTRTVLENL